MTPSKKERLFTKEYSYELIKIADGDFNTAIALSKVRKSEDIRIENMLYMLQQALEKAIKAVLVYQGVSVPLVHDLGVLITKIPKEIEPPFGYELSELNEYASIRRYEEGMFILSDDEITDIFDKTSQMLNWARKIIKKKSS